MPHTILGDRQLIAFRGPDAEHLLHNVVTCNIESLVAGVAQVGALLTPQGKVMFDFIVSKQASDHFIVEIEADHAAQFMQRMVMYRMRSKVEISQPAESLVRVSWDDDSSNADEGLRDVRFKDHAVTRQYVDRGEVDGSDEWARVRVQSGVPESGPDYTLGDVFPHDISLDQNGGVDFKKGCYIGQEVVSRMHHRHTARRRILIASSLQDFRDESAIVSNGKALGTLGTKTGNLALALCRIDRVKDAVDAGQKIAVGDAVITLALPPSVSYDWPAEAENG